MTTLFLMTGFLGSGKTSVLSSLLEREKDRKVGLIINDFGSVVIDEHLVEKSGQVVATKSLSGGQIFCSCLSGSFIDSVEALLQYEVDLILVETSGLAKPAPLLEIISVILQRNKEQVAYGGMICIIDLERYQIISQALKTIEEQIVFSDGFILNKADLVDQEMIETVTKELETLRPLAPKFVTTFGHISDPIYELWKTPLTITTKTDQVEVYGGWGSEGRPENLVFTMDGKYTQEELEDLLRSLAPKMHRIKGFLAEGYTVDVVGPHITVRKAPLESSVPAGVVCIYKPALDAKNLIINSWAGKEATVKFLG